MAATLTIPQIKRLLKSVGRENDTSLEVEIPSLILERQESKPLTLSSSRLLFLYVRVDLIDLLLGGTWKNVNFKEGDESENLSDQSKNLAAIRSQTKDEIEEMEAEIITGLTGSGSSIGQLTTQATIENSCPNPNERAYMGDPLRRSFGGFR